MSPRARFAAPLLALALFAAAPVAARQDEPITTPAPVAPDALSQARAAAARGDAAEALSRYLRVLATAPDNVSALAGAGRAALDVGDVNAAAGFYARADALNPRDGMVKAGLAATVLQQGNARGALKLFNEAVELGVPAGRIAADRGLAWDLRGSPRRAQADYALALRERPDDAEVTRRLALSQAIAGDRVAAMATLDPLLRRQDVPAWRARALVFALTGDAADATTGAALVMPREQVAALQPYLPRLAGLRAADKAAAVHLGRFPGEGARPTQTASANAPKLPLDKRVLAPPPLPAAPAAPVVTAAATPPPAPVETAPTPAPAPTRVDRRQARAQAAAAAKAKAEARREAEEKAAARKNPARHWVQVAGGANKRDLGRAWDQLKAKWPKQLAGRSPWTLHYRYTNRLLIGPFPSSDAAQDWVSERRKEGFATFRVETNAGDPVERVKG